VLKRAAVIEAVGASFVTSGTTTGVAMNSDAVGGAVGAVFGGFGCGVHDAGACLEGGNPDDVVPSTDGDHEFAWPGAGCDVRGAEKVMPPKVTTPLAGRSGPARLALETYGPILELGNAIHGPEVYCPVGAAHVFWKPGFTNGLL